MRHSCMLRLRFFPSTLPAEFWLRPEHVVRFKAEVMRHLPILIYGDRTRLTESERQATTLSIAAST